MSQLRQQTTPGAATALWASAVSFKSCFAIIGVWTSVFMLLFALVGTALPWMHFAIRRMEQAHFPEISSLPELPEL